MSIRSLVGFLFEGTNDRTFGIINEQQTIASFEVDAVLSETHVFSRQITENPVENGQPINDHIIINPVTLEIQCIVTDAPIKGIIEGVQNAYDNFLKGSRYTNDCFGALYALYELKDFLTVYTQYRTYEKMVVENITISRAPEDGEALIFTISLKQVRVVRSATTTLPKGIGVKPDGKSNAKGDAKNRATPNKDVGKNTGAEVDDGASILKKASDAAGSSISEIMKNVKGQLATMGIGQ